MTREIIFRGKRIDNGEWVEGSLLKVTIGGKTAHLIFGDNFCFVGNDVEEAESMFGVKAIEAWNRRC